MLGMVSLATVWACSRVFATVFMMRNGHGYGEEKRKQHRNGFHFSHIALCGQVF